MPYQAIAWAWKVPLADPVERLMLIWAAGRCSSGDWLVDDAIVEELEAFCGGDPREAAEALERLQERGLVHVRMDGRSPAIAVVVRVPQAPAVQVAEDNWEHPENRDPLPLEMKARVLAAHRRTCFACGSKSEPQVDHIIPRRIGGTNHFTNLQVLCGPCNRRKRDKTGWVHE